MSATGFALSRPGPVAVAGGLAAGFVLLALVGPLAAPHDPLAVDLTHRFEAPGCPISSAPTISAATSSPA